MVGFQCAVPSSVMHGPYPSGLIGGPRGHSVLLAPIRFFLRLNWNGCGTPLKQRSRCFGRTVGAADFDSCLIFREADSWDALWKGIAMGEEAEMAIAERSCSVAIATVRLFSWQVQILLKYKISVERECSLGFVCLKLLIAALGLH
jgi:hypothetical protein